MAKSRKKRAVLKQQRLVLAEQARLATLKQEEQLQRVQELNRQADDETLAGTPYHPGGR